MCGHFKLAGQHVTWLKVFFWAYCNHEAAVIKSYCTVATPVAAQHFDVIKRLLLLSLMSLTHFTDYTNTSLFSVFSFYVFCLSLFFCIFRPFAPFCEFKKS